MLSTREAAFRLLVEMTRAQALDNPYVPMLVELAEVSETLRGMFLPSPRLGCPP